VVWLKGVRMAASMGISQIVQETDAAMVKVVMESE